MSKRITVILILTTFAAVGILIFQGYWLFDSYQIRRSQFQKDVNQALQVAVNRELKHRLQSKSDTTRFKIVEEDSATPGTLLSQIFSRLIKSGLTSAKQFDTLKIESKNNSSLPVLRLSTDNNDSSNQHNVERILSGFLKNKVNRSLLDSLYHQELQARNISTPYALEFSMADTVETETDNRSTDRFTTRTVAVSWMESRYVRAVFPSPQEFLLSQMKYNLGASALLLLITLGCYGYMLITIFRQKKLSEVKNDFINNMTHEFKTPISSASAAIEALQHFNVLDNRERTDQYLDMAQKEMNRLSEMVNRILRIATHEEQPLELNTESVELDELLQSLVEQNRVRYQESAEIKYQNEAGPVNVRADRTHITNAVQNLVDNAVKYGGNLVNIALQNQGNTIQITVSDNGPGIPSSHQDKIFDRFYRIPTGDIHNVKGFGLGLSYVRHVVEQHGGTISVESDSGSGADFFIKLPINRE